MIDFVGIDALGNDTRAHIFTENDDARGTAEAPNDAAAP